MTILTPNFADKMKMNGATPHVTPAHEPLRGEPVPPLADSPHKPTSEVAAAPGPLKVALIGTAPSSRMLAPFNDPSWTIWGCSPGNMNVLPRVDCWFELHSNLLWPEYESYGRPYIEWMKAQTFPVFMQDQSLVPNAVTFPKNELVAEFGDEFFTSSFAWMMAHAMKLGAVEIALYGIDMASRDEYIQQRPGFYYFKREAIKRGVKVSAPHESDIMQSPALYAYVDSTPFGRKLMARKAEVAGRLGGMRGQRDGLNNNITYLEGAHEDIDYMISIWSGVANDMGRIQYENDQLKQVNARQAALIGQLQSIPVWSMSSAERVPDAQLQTMSSTVVGPGLTVSPAPPVPEPKVRKRRKKQESLDGQLLDH